MLDGKQRRKRKSFENEHFFIREDFLKRCKNLNPAFVAKYSKISNDIATHFCEKNAEIVYRNGYNVEDINSMVNMLIMYYHELYSPNSTDKYFDKAWERIEKKNGGNYKISDEDWERIVRSDMINFIKGQLSTFKTRLYMRNENISVTSVQNRYFVPTSNYIKSTPEQVENNHIELGYKEITSSAFEQLSSQGVKNLVVTRKIDTLSNEDYENIMYHSNIYEDPADRIISSEDDVKFSRQSDIFQSMSKQDKREAILQFIKENQSDPKMSKEIQLAKKMLDSKKL